MIKAFPLISQGPESLLRLMESLADATRLRLLRLLERHELGVVELCDILQLPQSTVSRHLKVLSDQKWTRSHRKGTNNLYRTILDELDAPARKLWLLAREQTADWATARQDDMRLGRHLREKQRDSQAFFAGTARQWDKLRKEYYGSAFTAAAMLSALPSDYVVADLGCGTGQLSAELAGYVGKVIAVDNSAAMMKAAQKRLAEFENVELRPGELDALPIDDATCDVAMIVLVLSYLVEPRKALSEAARIVKRGGKVIVVDLLPHDRDDFRRQMEQRHAGFEVSEIERWLGEAGMTNVVCWSLPPEPNVKGPAMFVGTATG